MKLRSIISETYEGLPDEDQFGERCTVCNADLNENLAVECAGPGCERCICHNCIFSDKGGWLFDHDEYTYSGLGVYCPEHSLLVNESYEDLPGEDEFTDPMWETHCTKCDKLIGNHWQGLDEGDRCANCEGTFCTDCGGKYWAFEGSSVWFCNDCAQRHNIQKNFLESYEGLPDEDLFGGYGHCIRCNQFVREDIFAVVCWACGNTAHFGCVVSNEEDIQKYENSQPGLIRLSSNWTVHRKKRRRLSSDDVHDLWYCHDCADTEFFTIGESYEGLPDEDEFIRDTENVDEFKCDWCRDAGYDIWHDDIICDRCSTKLCEQCAGYRGEICLCPGCREDFGILHHGEPLAESYEGLPDEDEFTRDIPQEVEALFDSLNGAKIYCRVYGPFDNNGTTDDIHYFNWKNIEVTEEVMAHPAFREHQAENYAYNNPWMLRIMSITEEGFEWMINYWPNQKMWELTTR